MKNPLFYAKILLFGEYGIIQNSKGLTIPYNFYKGTLKFGDANQKQKDSSKVLKDFCKYLKENSQILEDLNLDLEAFQKDLQNNLYFDSDIPQGYGVGSSGALVAAIYHRYAQNKFDPSSIKKDQIALLKNSFGLMECFFHGKSSGVDPLICYLNIPLLIHSQNEIDKVGLPGESQSGKGAVFLLNSGEIGHTAPLIDYFFDKMKNEGFRKTLKEEFIKYNDACIESFLKGDFSPLFGDLKKLSTWVMVHFKPMIPKPMLQVWQQGLSTNDYYLKLCGSGGGGYILGFTRDYQKAEKLLKAYHPQKIYSF
ncbi:MAG: mevalonate kinase [Flavobacteriaceae bacterium]|nr:MAG: mevalonate kinase [Flavobacteriaceae bacterium]